MITALIPRHPEAPKLHVLEVDGPRRKHCQRGEGSYYLNTNNHPMIDSLYLNAEMAGAALPSDPRLNEDFGNCWEVYQHHDGSIEINACRPTDSEACEGDLFGELGSVVRLTSPTRLAYLNGMRLARRLLNANPTTGLLVSHRDLIGILIIETDIPVYLQRDS